MQIIEFVEDCQRIQKILLSYGWETSLFECQELWGERSGNWDANWLHLPEKDSDIIKDLNEYGPEHFYIHLD